MTTPMENKPRILVVEDETPARQALHDKLTREGFRALEARNGAEGLALARREHPDLILLDLIMPVMDGLTMLKKLRADAWGKTAPVIILTNLSSDNDQVNQYVTKSQQVNYLIKSDWRIEDVVAKIRERLAEKTPIPPPAV